MTTTAIPATWSCSHDNIGSECSVVPRRPEWSAPVWGVTYAVNAWEMAASSDPNVLRVTDYKERQAI